MVVLPESPKSFKLDRKSNFSSKLKPLISYKLNLIFPDLNDDILAEYITVLVCNGKNQYQVRDDLQPFLGSKAQEFVSWLWKFLLKNETQFTASVSSEQKDKTFHSSCDFDKDKSNANRTFNRQSQGNSGSANLMQDENEEIFCSIRQACKSDDIEPPMDHHPPPAKEMIIASLSQVSLITPKAKCIDLSPKTASLAQKGSASKLKHASASVEKSSRCSKDKVTAGLLKRLPDKDPASLLGRGLPGKDPAGRFGRLPASLPARSPASRTHFSNVSKPSECPQRRFAGNALRMSFGLLPAVPPSHINQPRSSVWDRLGKPRQDAPARRQITDISVRDKVHCSKTWIDRNLPFIPKPSEQIDLASPLTVLSSVQGGIRLRQCHQVVQGGDTHKIDDDMRPKIVGKTDSEVPLTCNIGRKRQFGEISSHIDAGLATERRADNQFEIACQSSTISELANTGRKRQYGKIVSHIDAGVETEKRADKKFEKACQPHKISEVPSEASQSVVPQVNDMKSRLRQVEIEVVKLRAKQMLMEKEGKTNLLTISGVAKPTQDESRTVLVTNVHFKATKETLALYFQKCGGVVDVELANNIPSAQARSAYITFQKKEAADKALGFSGASFYSKSIKVCRKGEFPSTATTSDKTAGKKMQITLSSNVDHEDSHFKRQNESISSVNSEPLSSNCDQTKTAAESNCQQGT